MSTTALTQSPLSRLTRTPTPSSESPSTRTKSPITLPTLNITPLKNAVASSSPAPAPSPATSTPGRWQHPRMDEVIRRQNASTFDRSNVRTIIANGTVLACTFALPPLLSHLPLPQPPPYTFHALTALRLLLTLLALLPLVPLLRGADTCEDIPLTPQQRHTLGLPPATRSLTAAEQTQLQTPPRYASPLAGSPASTDSTRVQARGSPLSGRGSPLDSSVLRGSPSSFNNHSTSAARWSSGGPFAGSMGFAGGNGSVRRGSFGSTGRSSVSEFEGFSSPVGVGSVGGKSGRASVGLNSKWLYERGRGSPGAGAGGGMGAAWGTGSVFN